LLVKYTVHIISPSTLCVACKVYLDYREYFSIAALKDLLEMVNTHTVLDFVKYIGFYSHI